MASKKPRLQFTEDSGSAADSKMRKPAQPKLLTDEQKASLTAEGYTISAMFDGASDLNNNGKKIADTEAWMTTSLFRGLAKNQVELLPLNQSSIIDVNSGLQGQQHPKY